MISIFVLLSGIGLWCDVLTAAAAGKMYWIDNVTARIQRANLDGTAVQNLFVGTPGVFLPGGLALDVTAGKLYWTNILARKIQRANLDGTGVQDVLTAGPHAQMYGIALDIAGGLMYWVERFGDAGDKVRIRRARLMVPIRRMSSQGCSPRRPSRSIYQAIECIGRTLAVVEFIGRG